MNLTGEAEDVGLAYEVGRALANSIRLAAVAGELGVQAGARRKLGPAEAVMAGEIRVGVGGWVFEPWRGVFYPDGLKQADELAYMSAT